MRSTILGVLIRSLVFGALYWGPELQETSSMNSGSASQLMSTIVHARIVAIAIAGEESLLKPYDSFCRMEKRA